MAVVGQGVIGAFGPGGFEAQGGQGVQHPVGAFMTAVIGLHADDGDDELRRHTVLGLGLFQRSLVLACPHIVFRGFAQKGAKYRTEQQCIQERTNQHGKDGDGKIAHKLPGYAGPEKHGQKGSERGGRRSCYGPEHAFCGGDVSLLSVHSLGHFPVREFDHNNGAIDQHAKAQQHAEHHHEVEGIANLVNDDDREQQRDRNTQTDDNPAAEAHGGNHEYHDQGQSGNNITLQFGNLHIGKLGLVL